MRTDSPTLPIKAGEFGFEQARHLLWRAGFGGTPAQIQTLVEWGPERSVDYLLEVERVPFEEVRADLFDRDIMRPATAEERAALALASRTQDEETLARFRAERQERQRRDRRQMREIQKWWLKRMIETPRPLEEKMTLFWHGHFATSYRTIEDSYHMFQQNQLFRRYAVGNYGELLYRIIRDPAMLAYLDNDESRKDRPNENLARELMELFSLGVGNYTERDIKEGARALTGYTYRDDEFYFDERNHDTGEKTILGRRGALDGDGFVTAILERRACAEFMCRKLYRFFAAELPENGRVDRDTSAVLGLMVSTMLSSRYEVRPVLRRLLLCRHFYSEAVVGQRIKSPVELVVGAVRTLNTPVRDLSVLVDALRLMGQDIFFPPSVAGWEGGRSWINTSTLFVRQNVLSYLLTGKKPEGMDAMASEEVYDPTVLVSDLARVRPGAEREVGAVVEYLLRLTLGRSPAGARETLESFVRSHASEMNRDLMVGVLLLITAMPEYQLC